MLEEARRLERFSPPFAFSAFFSPEDTLLCLLAAESALGHLAASDAGGDGREPIRVAELTSGSGLVGLHLLGLDLSARLLGLDIDKEATRVSTRNAQLLGVSSRAEFVQSDLWSDGAGELLASAMPQLLVCNPPYIPEPPDGAMGIEAGAGPNGTAHLLRALELTDALQPEALALSWCSVSAPGAIVRDAAKKGYRLDTLYLTVIADGEYSGSVHKYLRGLPHAYISEQPDTIAAVAPDESASFAYLLFAGAFSRRKNGDVQVEAAGHVERICSDFARAGVTTLATATGPFALHCSILNRWDELQLRIILHGSVTNQQLPYA